MLARFLWNTGSFGWLAQEIQIKDQIWRVQFGRSVRRVCSVRPQRNRQTFTLQVSIEHDCQGCSERE